MKRSSLLKLGSVLFISFALMIVWLGIGNYQPATAANLSTHITSNAADLSPYRLDASAQYYVSHQVWLVNLASLDAANISVYRWQAMAKHYLDSAAGNLTSRNAADASAYRWNAVGEFYSSHQVSSVTEMASIKSVDNLNYRIFMISPGVWGRETSVNSVDSSNFRFLMISPGFWSRVTTFLY